MGLGRLALVGGGVGSDGMGLGRVGGMGRVEWMGAWGMQSSREWEGAEGDNGTVGRGEEERGGFGRFVRSSGD